MAIPAVAYTRNIETLRRLVHESWRWLCARDPAEFAPDDRYAEIWAIVVTVRSWPIPLKNSLRVAPRCLCWRQLVSVRATAMMGQRSGGQEQLFYGFSLEDHVPAGHLLRGIDRCLDLSELRRQLAPFYSATGRPSIDPEVMIRMLLIGHSFGIRSERRLCEEVHLNLAYRWFCRLGLKEPVPDHSTFSKNRHGRFRESDVFRLVFENVVERCMKAGLVGGEGFAVDASFRAQRSRS